MDNFKVETNAQGKIVDYLHGHRPGWRRKEDLRRPRDVKGLLRRCHNKLHGRGVDGDEEDLTMDMVRLILAKAMDEEKEGELCEFYCTPEEYGSEHGRWQAAGRVHALFAEVVRTNSDIFSKHERITVGDRAICDVVVEVKDYRLLSDRHDSEDWDIMGHAYEQYTSTYLKRKRGQFFTNRLVVDFMAEALEPTYQDIILDPAGGSGGFLTGVMRNVRKKILRGKSTAISKQRQLDKHRTNLFMVEISKRLIKIAKTAMILNGAGHVGITQGDSLGDLEEFHENVAARCGEGKPTVILTNPPFAGVGEGRISDPRVLDGFQCGLRWVKKDGGYQPTGERNSEGVPPEMLFFERCLQWIAPGGRVGIVMPKSFLDTRTYYPLRRLLLDNFRLLAIVNCHKDTFQPHTGVRTCLVLVQRPKQGEKLKHDYSIFMSISKKIGQDSEGVPIFKRDVNNRLTEEVDHDFTDILADFRDHQQGRLKPSEYRFSIKLSDVDQGLRINPQVHLPNLNETIRQIESIDGSPGWSVSTIGQIANNVQIYKGPRLKSENLIVERPGPGVEPYYTPSAILQEKSESAKLLDISLATTKQLATIDAVRVHRGDIVITRSGTIGRVAYITRRYDRAIASDDLIRVRIPDEQIRLYVFAYLQSEAALNQMKRNEYGSVQQHLEPVHIAGILIPVPEDWQAVSEMVQASRKQIKLKEAMEQAAEDLNQKTDDLITGLISRAA